MNRTEFVQDLLELFLEKDIRLTPGSIRYFEDISTYLATQGIPLTREILDFTIDLVRVIAMIGLEEVSNDEELAAAKEKISEWLEVLGWRRSWFRNPLGTAL